MADAFPDILSTDMSCVVLFGACIEGVVLRDKWVKLIRANLLLASI